jgi:hypothetical protein
MAKVKTEKLHRATDGREAERREQIIRNIQNMDYRSTLYIDPDIIPPGWDYAWATISVLGQPRPGRLIGLRQVGWEIVPPERHPELLINGKNNDSTAATAAHVERDGLVLIERPSEFGEIERRVRAERDYKNLVNLPATENFMGEPGIPGHNQGSTYITKNASFGE